VCDAFSVDLTESYRRHIPPTVLARYHWAETRQAAGVIAAAFPTLFADIVKVLDEFTVIPLADIQTPGGNESAAAARLNKAFRDKGWREASMLLRIISVVEAKPHFAGDPVFVEESEANASSYLIDNLAGTGDDGRVAVDVEWHAKDGNLDRDLAAYRALYEAGVISAGVIITTKREDMRGWAVDLLGPDNKKFSTSTVTSLEKLTPRLVRGDGGGCPVLAIGIGRATV
jgi:hypothetical protein